jgi:hypothetical protein
MVQFEDREMRFSHSSFSISRGSSRSVFCFRTRLVLISAGCPIHNSKPNSASNRSNQRACPVASIPTRTLTPLPLASGRIAPLHHRCGLVPVHHIHRSPPLKMQSSESSGDNQHLMIMSCSFLPSLGRRTTTVYSGRWGASIVMKSRLKLDVNFKIWTVPTDECTVQSR